MDGRWIKREWRIEGWTHDNALHVALEGKRSRCIRRRHIDATVAKRERTYASCAQEHVFRARRGARRERDARPSIHVDVARAWVFFVRSCVLYTRFVTTVDRWDDVGGPTDVGFPPCPPRAVAEGRVPNTRTSACGDGAEEGRV